jgi:hypothetical protein
MGSRLQVLVMAGGCPPGNLPTTAVGLRETPSGDIAVREMVQRQGVGGS